MTTRGAKLTKKSRQNFRQAYHVCRDFALMIS